MINKSLFGPDNFSEPKINYSHVQSSSIVKITNIVGQYVDPVKSINVLALHETGVQSVNFKITISENGVEKNYLLRRYITLNDKNLINKYLDFQNKLILENAPVALSIPLLHKKSQYVFFQDGFNYAFFEFIKGCHFFPNNKNYLNLARSVAKLHLVFSAISLKDQQTVARYSKSSSFYFNVVKQLDNNLFEKIIYEIKKIKKSEEKDLILKSIFRIRELFSLVEKNKQRIDLLPRSLIHSDLHPHNILVNFENQIKILDFDTIRLNQRPRDVAMVIYRCGRQFLVNHKKGSDLKSKAKKIRDIFLKEYEKIYPLTREEKELMPVLLYEEMLIKLLFVLKEKYINRKNKWGFDIIKFINSLFEIEYFWTYEK